MFCFRVSSYGRRERERKRKVHEEETRARLLREKREMKQELLTEMLKAKLNVQRIRIPELTEVCCIRCKDSVD